MQKADQTEFENGGPSPAPLRLPSHLHDTFFMTDQVIEYVTDRREPWCVHLSLLRPHPPWIAPAPYHARYAPDALPGFVRAESAEGEGEQHPWLAFQLSDKNYRAPESEKKLRRLKASYYGLMSEVDDNLGRLFAHLKATGAVRRHADRVHLGSRRADRRSLAARQVRLLRPVVSHPADRARSARVGRCNARPHGRRVHRERRHHADDARVAGHRRAARVRRPLADPLLELVSGDRAGATKRTGSSISAIPPTTAPSARSAFRSTRARST